MVDTLGSHYEIMLTNIKKFSVGSQIQAAAEAMTSLVSRHRVAPSAIREVEVLLPPSGAKIVDGRHMPDVNLQYCMAAIALDGGKLTFEATHTYDRLNDPSIVNMMAKVSLRGHDGFAHLERQRPATVRIHTQDGNVLEEHCPAVKGTADNPMSHQEIEDKARDLVGSVYGEPRGTDVVDAIMHVELLADVRDLRPLLTDP
jgi:2-methylcitrate dehydratase PrpD